MYREVNRSKAYLKAAYVNVPLGGQRILLGLFNQKPPIQSGPGMDWFSDLTEANRGHNRARNPN
jgi:hypothetical protein